MRTRKHQEVTRATARVARTIPRSGQAKPVYCTGDPRGRPGPDERGRPGNSIIHYIAGSLALALACFCLLCIIFFTTSAHASVGTGYHTAQMPLDPPTDTSTPSPTDTSTPSPTVVTTTPSPTVTT